MIYSGMLGKIFAKNVLSGVWRSCHGQSQAGGPGTRSQRGTGGLTFRENATERGGLKERFSVGIGTWGLGTDARGRSKSHGCGFDFILHAVFRESRNVAQGGNEDAVTCWETRSYSWRIYEPLLLYDENIGWVHNDLSPETNRQTQLRAKWIIKTSRHRPCCWLHYDRSECEWFFKAVITLATCVCVQLAFRSMWATSLTCGTLEHFISQ